MRSGVGYDNCKMLSPTGDLLSYTSNKKGIWYLRKKLAEKIQDNPLIIRLLFEPDVTYKLIEDSYYHQALPSICVVCGTSKDLTKHHCVPSCYRQHFPYEYKAHNYHDIVLLCLSCHHSYEEQAELLKKKLREDYGISLKHPNESLKRVIYTAQLLIKSLEGQLKLPKNSFDRLQQVIIKHLGKIPILNDLIEISKTDLPKIDYNPSQLLVSKVDISDFIKLWRKHFVDTMNPDFLPPFWSLDKIYKVTRKKNEVK